MDLSETQSQGNEWMYMRHLQSQLPNELYQATAEYKLSTDVGYILCFVMIDEFERFISGKETKYEITEKFQDKMPGEIVIFNKNKL